MAAEERRRLGEKDPELEELFKQLDLSDGQIEDTEFGSAIFAKKPGDGSAREQAASCQRVLGGRANIVYEYATKRYRSNCINWGIIPFTISRDFVFIYEPGDYLFIPAIRKAIQNGTTDIPAVVIGKNKSENITLHCENLNEKEKQIILDGCLMNYYAGRAKEN